MTRMLAKDLIKFADPEALCSSSFDDYHVPGVAYLNLYRSPTATGKLYLFEPGKWSPVAGRYVVNPHDHAYEFSTHVLAGAVGNHLFVEKELEYHTDDRWTFTSRVGFSDPKPVCLVNYRNRYYSKGESYFMTLDEVHTISVEPDEPTVLFLIEAVTVRERTRCYLPAASPEPTLEGLYRPMTPERYAEALAAVVKLISY